MNNKWKYVEKLDKKTIKKIENKYNILLPDDYKKYLPNCNRGKPTKKRFDLESREEAVIDYMFDLNKILSNPTYIKDLKLFPIARDPFGNLIAFEINGSKISGKIIFWDHETKKSKKIANDFTSFLKNLY